eukprot:TRINITY_DN3416_c0_g1_i11.p1 TRINITY_DN3416_c0_g1~~TRINITY_DN3416_c0_g1_i11.p1  ORF type:complete len:378 (+),score=33.79 TRINITY_DN3416_c0_g1_i11:28-1134(+)
MATAGRTPSRCCCVCSAACAPPAAAAVSAAPPAVDGSVGWQQRGAPPAAAAVSAAPPADVHVANATDTSLYVDCGRDRHRVRMGLRANDIQLGQVLGWGGQAEVRLARDTVTGSFYALKILKKLRYRDEARLKAVQGEIRGNLLLPVHRNLVTSIDLFYQKGELSVLMEYVRYGSLHDLLRCSKNVGVFITEPVMAAFTVQTLQGLDFLKQRSVLHRDLKPDNILVGEQGVVKIGDFGICRLLDEQGHAHTDIGSKGYVSPERPVQYSYPCEVWALGKVVAADMAAMRCEWDGRSVSVTWREQPDGTQAGQDIRDFTKRCLNKTPSARPTPETLLRHPFVNVSSPEHTVLQWVHRVRRVRDAPAPATS